MSKKTPYLPKVRTSYHPTENEIRSYSPNGESTMLPNPANDPIVANNISGQEFDYTDSLADEGDSILPDDNRELNLASLKTFRKEF